MPDDALTLRDYLAVLSRRRWIVVATVVVVTAVAVGLSLLQDPLYEATADVTVEPFRQSEDMTLQDVILGDVTVNTEQQVLTSRAVTQRVIDDLDLDLAPEELLENVRVDVVRDTRVLRVVVRDQDPELAAEVADGYAQSYLEERRDAAGASLEAASAALRERETALRTRLDEVRGQLTDLEPEAVDGIVTESTLTPEERSLRTELSAERDGLVAQLNQVAAQAAEADSGVSLLLGGGRVLNPAVVPVAPVSPKPLRTGALAVVMGLLLGLAAAFLRDHLDDVIRDEEDIRRDRSAPRILGRIPGHDEGDRLATIVSPHTPQVEAFRSLSTSVRFLVAASDDATSEPSRGRVILVTSPRLGAGKTSTAANLAVVSAQAGNRVLLVDADLRRSSLAGRFGLPEAMGLSDLLVGEVELADVVVDVGVGSLRVLPAGTTPPNPSELLASSRMRSLCAHLVEAADLVIIDTPPILAVSDTLELVGMGDVLLMVVRARHARRRLLREALDRVRSVGAGEVGLVINDLDDRSTAYGYYGDETVPTDGPRRGWSRQRQAPPGGDAPTTMPPSPQDEVEAEGRGFGRADSLFIRPGRRA